MTLTAKESKRGSNEELSKIAGALLGMFATLDDVFTEPNAFENRTIIRAGFGRCYREWKEVRKALDPEFNPNHFKVSKSPMKKWVNYQHPHAGTEQTFITLPTWMNDLNLLKNALKELKSV